MRSVREDLGPSSWIQAATRFRGFAGLTVIDVSSSWPAIMVESNAAPGQPAGNGLGPDTSRSAFTLYGIAVATAGTTWATTATPMAVSRIRNRRCITHAPFKSKSGPALIAWLCLTHLAPACSSSESRLRTPR